MIRRPTAPIALALAGTLLGACAVPAPRAIDVAERATLVEPLQPTASSPARIAPAPTPRSRHLARAVASAVDARGLTSNGTFESRHVDRAEMERVVRAQVERELPAEVLAHEESAQKLLSVIDPDENYLELVFGMLGSQVAGLYIPREKALYVVDDGVSSEGSADEHTVLVHEIVHAIQDEHFDLGRRVEWRREGGDETAAIHSLGEGDATLAMLLDTSRGEGLSSTFVADFTSLMRETNRRLVGARVPSAVADALVDPYVEGLRFVWSLYSVGGWAAVNAAWASPPRSTEQLLHVEKFAAREAPVALSMQPVAPAGFDLLEASVVGELDVRDWFSAFVEFEVARSFARGWGNGRTELFGRGSERALRLRIRWDEDATAQAERAAKRMTRELVARFGHARHVGAFRCVERPRVGPLAWASSRRDLVVLAGPATFENGHAASTSSCASLAAWAAKTPPGHH